MSAQRATETRPAGAARAAAFDVRKVRKDFPILEESVHGKPLVYLDNAATAQKPRAVIEAVSRFYAHENANIHRGLHLLSEKSTEAYEKVRDRVQRLLNAPDRHEIVFVRGTTEGINLVAATFGRMRVKAGDEVLVSTMEHHSNIVPWQLLCEQAGAHLRVIPITDAGEIRLDEYEKMIGPRTKIVSVVHVSNSLGTINPVRRMVEIAHARGVPVLLDGAQALPHMAVDVQEIGCDFYAFSGHKMFGPSGIGILYGKLEHLEAMPPYQGGGDMISSVSFEKTTWNRVPHKFEAGTPDIAGVIGLGAGIDYLDTLDPEGRLAWEEDLLRYATDSLSAFPGLTIHGTAPSKASVISFTLGDVHPHDIGTILDQQGIAIRAGHHCTQPLMDRLGIPATARASMAFYNTREEIDALVAGLHKVREVFDR